MIRLAGTLVSARNIDALDRRLIIKLSRDASEVSKSDGTTALLLSPGATAPDHCTAVAVTGHQCVPSRIAPYFELPSDCEYVADGDIIRLEPSKNRFRVLFRKSSAHNNFLVTEQCDNFCLMCSQPPKKVDDRWVLEDLFQTVQLIEPDTKAIGFTGGEPTMWGERFIDLITLCRERLPGTSVHVLSNGRRFSDPTFAKAWASISHRDLMIGIPVYSDLSTVHDFVVQADGAFDETVRGILNLKERRQRVEIRVVLHKQTFARLPQLARFIARNLLFVDHVAFMGLEITGFTRANLEQLWIDPVEYQRELYDAVTTLDDFGVPTSIYNLQLCLLDRRLWRYAVRSISDWKRDYFPACGNCAVRSDCGGVFVSAVYRHSKHIKAILQSGRSQ